MSDGDLLIYSALRDEDPILGRLAFSEFHRRYMARLDASCRQLARRFGLGSDLGDDLAAAAIARAIEKASTYHSDTSASAEGQRKRTLGWLYRIAENILFDWHRNPLRPSPLNQTSDDRHVEDYGSDDFAILAAKTFDAHGDSSRLRLLAHAFETVLDDRERHVLLATLLYRTYSPAGTYMQRGKAQELAGSFGTTAPNVRKIRQRAMAKICRCLNEKDPRPARGGQ